MKTVFTFAIVTMAILTGWLELRPQKQTTPTRIQELNR